MKNRMKISIVAMLLCVISVVLLAFNSNDVAYGFGGMGYNFGGYLANCRSQITTKFNSDGSLTVTGYQYFDHVQNYLYKGNTHSYVLKLNDKTYSDQLAGSQSESLTSISALQGNKTSTSHIYYLGANTDGYNIIYNQVTFKFTVPASDILAMTGGDYKLSLVCTVSNVIHQGTSTRRTYSATVDKLVDTNFLQGTTKSATLENSANALKATINTDGVNTVFINASNVFSRTQPSKNSPHCAFRYIVGNTIDKKTYSVSTSVADATYGNYLHWVPLTVRYNTSSSVVVSNSTPSAYDLQHIKELENKKAFWQKRYLYFSKLGVTGEMYNAEAEIRFYTNQLATYKNTIANRTTTITTGSKGTATSYVSSLFLEGVSSYGTYLHIEPLKKTCNFVIRKHVDGKYIGRINSTPVKVSLSDKYKYSYSIPTSSCPTGYGISKVTYTNSRGEKVATAPNFNKGIKSASGSINETYAKYSDTCYIDIYYTNNAPKINGYTSKEDSASLIEKLNANILDVKDQVIWYEDENKSYIVLPYGSQFVINKNDVDYENHVYELKELLIKSVTDIEDGNIPISKVSIKTPSNFKYNYILDGKTTYTITFTVTDKGGEIKEKTIDFYVEKDVESLKAITSNQSYLQGTALTNRDIAKQIFFYDEVTNEKLSYTNEELVKGTYKLVDLGGLDMKKVTNYTYEYYITHKDECDAENTFNVKFTAYGRGGAVLTKPVQVTLIPVFPEFYGDYEVKQIHEGFMPIYGADGKISSFTNKLTIEDLRNKEVFNMQAFTYINGNAQTEEENNSDTIKFHSVTYVDGTTKTDEQFITTSNGTYGSDLKATKNFDGTYTMEDDSIYPYRGVVNFVVEAANSYGNSRLSSYGSDVGSEYYKTEVAMYEDAMGQSHIGKEYKDWVFGVDLKPQSEPVINGSERYMFVDEEITRENLDKRLEALDVDANGKEIDITGDIVIGKVVKVDSRGNVLSVEFECDDTSALFSGGSLQPTLDENTGNYNYNEVIDTSKKCQYLITFYVKNNNNRVSSFDVSMHVVSSKVFAPYIRTVSLQYSLKIPENLDENGNNIYFEENSVWMNNPDYYENLIYSLCLTELMKYDELDDEDVVLSMRFTHGQIVDIASWQQESGIAMAGQDVPEDTLVKGYYFKDENGKDYILTEDENEDKHHIYIKDGSLMMGMSPGRELNQKLLDKYFDECVVVNNIDVSYQGDGCYIVIRNENGDFLYEDKETGERRISPTNDPADSILDTTDYSVNSVFKQGTITLITKRYADAIASNSKLYWLTRVIETL